MTRRPSLPGLRPWFALAVCATPAWGDEPPLDFNRAIRPILTQHCTACHGGVKAAGKISFVYREKALAEGKSGKPAIVPGHPEQSELIRRVRSTDPDDVMPKPDHGPRLSEGDVATLTTWIAQGAPWSEHWAFVPPQEPPAPVLKDGAWAKTPTDGFVLARIEAESLTPSAPATPAEWLRRVSLDLTGLPPAPEEATSFFQQHASDPQAARAAAVDRLLASPHFGERWASIWLDLARYSDTYGFEKDPHREIWPWRDWVIRAFNADVPFDRFTVAQLAGDLLEKPTADDVLATAFHRNTQNNTEGGTDDEEYRTAAVLDRVNTTWTAWQATTFGCVQCHSHPYDPIPHADYYRFAAFFNNTEDCDQNDDFPRFAFAHDAAQRDALAARQRQWREDRAKFNAESVKATAGVRWEPLRPSEATTSAGTLEVLADGSLQAGGTLPIGVVSTVRVPVAAGVTALRLEILPDNPDPKKWPERGSVVSHATAEMVAADGSKQAVVFSEVIADFLAGPYDPQEMLAGGRSGFGSYPVMTGPRWCVLVLEKPLATAGTLTLVLKQGASANSDFQATPLRHFQLSATAEPRLAEMAADPARKTAREGLAATKRELDKAGGVRVPVLSEREPSATRETRVFTRGNRLAPGELVSAGIPALVAPPDVKNPTRLDMARWLVSPQNPLTARVLANRLWAELFGHGIVETLEDFGTSGARPTNQPLLDHLALRLVHTHRWSVKSFLRELALSATYAQSAKATPELAERDPRNQLLARGPRSRLTAEMVRDQALLVSGKLSRKAFGPPVFPPQPDGIWSSVYNGETWRTSEGEDRFRRAVYTYHKRTSGYPGYLTFDAPTRDACTARRVPTNTPLQALVTLNDPAFIELAQAMAERMQQAAPTPREQIAAGAKWLTLADPPAALVDSLAALREKALASYQAYPETAKKLAPTPEQAALVLVANTLLNTDLALNR